MIVLSEIVVGARLDQLGCSGEGAALLDALSYPTTFGRIECSRRSEVSKVGWPVFHNLCCRSYFLFLGEMAPFFRPRYSHFTISKIQGFGDLIKPITMVYVFVFITLVIASINYL